VAICRSDVELQAVTAVASEQVLQPLVCLLCRLRDKMIAVATTSVMTTEREMTRPITAPIPPVRPSRLYYNEQKHKGHRDRSLSTRMSDRAIRRRICLTDDVRVT